LARSLFIYVSAYPIFINYVALLRYCIEIAIFNQVKRYFKIIIEYSPIIDIKIFFLKDQKGGEKNL
jgi:hypothetical protein